MSFVQVHVKHVLNKSRISFFNWHQKFLTIFTPLTLIKNSKVCVCVRKPVSLALQAHSKLLKILCAYGSISAVILFLDFCWRSHCTFCIARQNPVPRYGEPDLILTSGWIDLNTARSKIVSCCCKRKMKKKDNKSNFCWVN